MRLSVAGFLLLLAVATSSCTRHVRVTLSQGKDYSGLWSEYAYSNTGASQWAAIDANVPASVARSIRRWQLNNVTLRFQRCNDAKDSYPALASLNGRIFDYDGLKEPLPPVVKLTFYLPEQVQERERYDCALFDARGYSPVILSSEMMRLPQFTFVGERVRPLQ